MNESGTQILQAMWNFIKDLMTYQWSWNGHTFTLWKVTVLAVVLSGIGTLLGVMLRNDE